MRADPGAGDHDNFPFVALQKTNEGLDCVLDGDTVTEVRLAEVELDVGRAEPAAHELLGFKKWEGHSKWILLR